MGKNLILWLVIGATMISLFNMLQPKNQKTEDMSYSTFLEMVEDGRVDNAIISDDEVHGRYQKLNEGETSYRVMTPNDPSLVRFLIENNVDVKAQKKDESLFWPILISWFPMLLLIGVWIFFMRQMQGGGKGGPMAFGKSKAKLLNENSKKITFEDVAGCDEAKQEVTEVIEFLREPSKFTRLGGMIPKGILLVGPPGTGKTLLARAIAGEADVPFYSISGSDFVEMFVGVGASRVRDMFEQAKKSAPCIIFMDEIDAMGRHRGAGIGGGNDEREQTLNQLLVEMDGFESNEGVILVAATNRPDVLDPALTRPGRFDRQVVVPHPDLNGRAEILKVHMRKVPLHADVNISNLAKGTPGFSGAELANLVNEAALNAARRNADKVANHDFEMAKDKVIMGAERRSMIISDDQKKTTAYHEAGHTLVAKNLKHADPVHKVSIIPRGRALGVTMQLPEEDRFNHDRDYLEDQIAILMGGRLAEELVLNQKTTGASNDFERATQIARSMVTNWGMSDALGSMVYAEPEGEVFLGRSLGSSKHLSEGMATKVDAEVRRFIDDNYARARKILVDHMDQLHLLTNALLEHETLEGKEIDSAIAGEAFEKKVSKPPESTPPESKDDDLLDKKDMHQKPTNEGTGQEI